MLSRLTFPLCALAPMALAAPFDGVYRLAANSDCALVGVDGGAIAIADGVFHGVESDCQMREPVQVNNMNAVLYTMECAGEGEIWTERAMLMEKGAGDGIIMVWDGYAFVYDRCPEASVAED